MYSPLLKVSNLNYSFVKNSKTTHVIRNVNFELYPGEVLGLVGESGSGKSTIGNLLIGTFLPSSGEIYFDGKDLSKLSKKERKELKRHIQMIFQDPYSSLNPRMTVEEAIEEPLIVFKEGDKKSRKNRIDELLQLVGLEPSHKYRYPHELSGGQRQRVVIARALALNPKFLVCDEPIAALDVSIQAQIINLLKDLQKKLNLTYLFISHDLSIVKYLSDTVAVLYLGEIIEFAPSDELYKNPLHPYTKALFSAVSIPDPKIEKERSRIILKGEAANFETISKGCPFSNRCPNVQPQCTSQIPIETHHPIDHTVKCHIQTDLSA